MGWVNADNPPKEKQRVIVRCKTVGTTAGAFLWGKWITDLGSEHSEVTHWMPMPKPPGQMTNGDRIRTMTDAEIEKFLHEVYGRGMESVIFGESGEPVKGFTWTEDWLQQPAKED